MVSNFRNNIADRVIPCTANGGDARKHAPLHDALNSNLVRLLNGIHVPRVRRGHNSATTRVLNCAAAWPRSKDCRAQRCIAKFLLGEQYWTL